MIINQLIDSGIPVLSDKQTVQDALKTFNNSDFSQLPITGGNQYLGLILKEDLELHRSSEEIPFEIRNLKGVYTKPKDNILETLKIGHQNELEIIPVVDSNLVYLGSVKIRSCIHYLIENTSLGELGGILVLRTKKNDYCLSEIARIIEMEGSSLLHFFINEYDETSKELKITIKVDHLNLHSLERTFERYGYLVDAVFSEKEEMNVLKERYDSLMSYLNV
ncbi:MAG: CBS domain-containing protein [Saprospiraceae bacterium]|jgi:predicted transcriptional regulator